MREADALYSVREALAAAPGETSLSRCGCKWKRIAPGTFTLCGVRVSGDVVVKFCDYHEWYHEQPLEVQRQLGRQARARERGEENQA